MPYRAKGTKLSKKNIRKVGFRARNSNKLGKKVLKSRRLKGRYSLAKASVKF